MVVFGSISRNLCFSFVSVVSRARFSRISIYSGYWFDLLDSYLSSFTFLWFKLRIRILKGSCYVVFSDSVSCKTVFFAFLWNSLILIYCRVEELKVHQFDTES